MPDGTIEIITGKERRRRWSVEEKLRIVAEADEPGARIAEVAARNEVYPSLLFSWRRQVREGRLVPNHRPQFVPVRLISAAPENTAPPTRPATCSASIANRSLWSAMYTSRSQRLAASTVLIPSSANSFGRRSCSVPNARSDRPRA